MVALESRAVHALESRGLVLERAGAIPRRGLLGNRDAAFPAFDALSSTRRLIAKDLFPYFDQSHGRHRDSHCQVFRILYAEFYGIKLLFSCTQIIHTLIYLTFRRRIYIESVFQEQKIFCFFEEIFIIPRSSICRFLLFRIRTSTIFQKTKQNEMVRLEIGII